MVQEKVMKVGLEKEPGFMYYINKEGNVARGSMKKGGPKKEVVAETQITREPGYLYFVDKDGDVGRAKMARGGKSKKKTK